MKISVVVPVYNEQENVDELVEAVKRVLSKYPDWELVIVDDSSTDNTLAMAKRHEASDQRIKIVTYKHNMGQGFALRLGFKHASGDIIVTSDADLSYKLEDIYKLIEPLEENEGIDFVVGSPYKKGGGTEGIPVGRLVLSKAANRLIGFALPGNLHTVTGMFRAYRTGFLSSLELEANDKVIHFEILSKGLAIGAQVVEVPVILRGRRRGSSKIRIGTAIATHLVFSFFERPAILFEMIGSLMLVLGLLSGTYIVWLWQRSELDPTRPLMLLMALFIMIGALILSFSFIASQIVQVRKEIYRVQKENLEIKRLLTDKRK